MCCIYNNVLVQRIALAYYFVQQYNALRAGCNRNATVRAFEIMLEFWAFEDEYFHVTN
jgi:hypothetical protein